ncbi:MAG: 16S rRNA (guanine(966)-N(2))-methyltransferase RsmD [Candidatus Omnitrophica bacterium]|nr:16S rRNA (guanine(966)-N(2))-methyltransferase RsmD [Candidatus Omnitrophota bacterium]MDD5488782.1 16S rRNA (guanine(966)-N(2))-methyltransferase RsmD [Candidatus Omnitrophota bacterium]
MREEGYLRIVGGEFRGRRIKRPVLGSVRPTKDRIREAVFNVIASDVPGSIVLDLFAGSGAYGFEAISRGAQKAVFVESDPRCSLVIKDNAGNLDVKDKTGILSADAESVIMKMAGREERYNIIFADPPYNKNLARKTLLMINQYDILMPSGILILEHDVAEDVPDVCGGISILKQKTYGGTRVSFFLRDQS